MIHFLSPLPPKSTGTADYILQLLTDIEEDLGSEIRNHVVLWDYFEVANDKDILTGLGWQARDMREASFSTQDIVFCFLASNDFHRWVWSALSRKIAPNIISVIHDLTSFPMLRSMARDAGSGLTREDELLALQYEFGLEAEWIADHFDDLPAVSRYFLMGQGITLARSNAVVVHSQYARNRLRSEIVRGLTAPPILVASHPRPRFLANLPPPPGYSEKRCFCVGSIGFYSAIKRNDALLEAFGAFVQTLSQEDRELVRLVFVGKIDDALRIEADDIIKRWNIADLVAFTGYVDERTLQAWQKHIDLQMNLRFPSCGESSGTLARALALGKRVVCSAFAAFHEEPATWKVSTEPMEEFPQLIKVLEFEFDRWKLAPNAQSEVLGDIHQTETFSALIGDLLTNRLQIPQSEGMQEKLRAQG